MTRPDEVAHHVGPMRTAPAAGVRSAERNPAAPRRTGERVPLNATRPAQQLRRVEVPGPGRTAAPFRDGIGHRGDDALGGTPMLAVVR